MIYRTPKNKKIYKQYDERWASLPYPTKNYSFGGSGCGAVSVLHCIIEMSKYKNKTPAFVQPYMKQFAYKGHGTTWAGIIEGLKHYGLQNVRMLDTMPELWKELKKGDRVGILLFDNDLGPDKTRFTSGGHYIAHVGYKTDRKGHHWLYLKDSGGRNNSGWICYEKSMKGCIAKIFIGRLPNEIELPSKGYWEKGDLSPEICKIQAFLKREGFYKGYVAKKKGYIGKNTDSAIRRWQKAEGLTVDGKWGAECNERYEVKR